MSDRTFTVHSPLGEKLQFRSLSGEEGISRLFEFRIRLISETPSISAKELLGKDMSVEIDLTTERHGGGKLGALGGTLGSVGGLTGAGGASAAAPTSPGPLIHF